MNKKKLILENILKEKLNEYEKFHSLTKTKRISRYKSDKYWPKQAKTIYYKAYGRMPEIILPPPQISQTSLQQALMQRQSKRSFSNKQLTLEEISGLLHFSAGIKDSKQNRFYPSAGKRYPLEIYILTINSELKKGLYHYYVKDNSLEEVLSLKKFNFDKYFVDTWIKNANMVIIISSIFKRSSLKYGIKGYRFSLLEAGHLAQNIYLLSTLLNLNCCEIGGFIDDKLHTLIDIDGKKEAILTTIAVGK